MSIIRLACAAISLLASAAWGQSQVPIRDVGGNAVVSVASFANIFNVRELPSKHVLVNDGISRQLVQLDGQLRFVRVLFDSASAITNSYGPVATPRIAYRGDSSLFVDGSSFSFVILDEKGNIVRTIAPPTRRDFGYIASSNAMARPDGSLVYRIAGAMVTTEEKIAGGATVMTQHLRDSATLVAANFDRRTADTLVRLKQQSGTRATATQDASSSVGPSTMLINPIEGADEWTVLPDGSIAVLRARDFRIDFIKTDGTKSAGPALPYRWVQLDENQKQHIFDTLQRRLDNDLQAAAETGDRNEVLRATGAALLKFNPSMAAFIPKPAPSAAPSSTAPPPSWPFGRPGRR